MTEARQLAEDLLKAVNEGAGSARALVVTLLVLAVYIFIVVSGTNDEQLLRNSTVAVPTLSNATVPASAFYAVMPWAFLFLHLDLLIHLLLLSEKLARFNAAVEGLEDRVAQRDMRLRLAGFPFSSWLGRDPGVHPGLRRLQGVTVWASLVLLPLLALLYLQLGFLAYHSEAITWGQRLALLADVGLLYYFWPRLVQGRYTPPVAGPQPRGRKIRLPAWVRLPGWLRRPAWLLRLNGRAPVALLVFLLAITGTALAWLLRRLWQPALAPLAWPLLFLSLLVATIPDESVDRLARWGMGEHDIRVSSCQAARAWNLVDACDEISQPASLPVTIPTLAFFHLNGSWFHRALTVRDRVLAASELRPEVIIKVRSTLRDLRADKKTKLAGQEMDPMQVYEDAIYEVRGLDLRERDLRYADFSQSSFPSAQMDKAELDYAHLPYADLRRVSIRQGKLNGTNLFSATLIGANLINAILSDAEITQAILTNANLGSASLNRANLSRAILININLSNASLISSNLRNATLTGAHLRISMLINADFTQASLIGADLGAASLINANLSNAMLNGADLSHAILIGANLSNAQVAGADIYGAVLKGAYLNFADLTGAMLRNSTLNGADLSGANLTGANLYQAEQAGVLWFEKPIAGAYNRNEARAIMETIQRSNLDAEKIAPIKKRLYWRTGKTTDDLDFSTCLGEGCLEKNLAHNSQAWAAAHHQLVCLDFDTRVDKLVQRSIQRLKRAISSKNSEFDALPPAARTALRTAAHQALLDLARGPCAKELAQYLLEDIRKEAQ